MSGAVSPKRIGEIKELMALCELEDIIYFELAAARRPSDVPDVVMHPISIMERHTPERIEVRCRVEVETPQLRYCVDAAAQFGLDEPLDVPQPVLQEFVERVGVMAVYPYLREALHGLATKLREDPPILQLLRANSISVQREGVSADAAPSE